MALPAGSPWLSVRTGLLCVSFPRTATWDGSRREQDLPPYAASFKAELERAGYKVVTPGEDNLFESEASADYEAAAVITEAHVDGCMTRGALFTERGDIRGDADLKIDWQVYSRIKKQVVARVSTEGRGHLDTKIPGGVARLAVEAFTGNVRELLANADFRTAMNAPRPFTAEFQMPGQQSKIVLNGSLNAGPHKIADATGSVVTLLTGSGSGSGFLVSGDGYILTDAHVVGDDKNVRVRWSDGLETLASVERVAKNRDVAIIKTNPRDRSPLDLKRGPLTPGQRVYAIGSPRNKDFAGTVSSGVVSADRTVNGLRYVQSDVMVSHGSSGGPLLNEDGEVIGLTDLGIPNAGPTGEEGQAGLNLFTPIGDAMDFLSLERK
ncbi:MAG TPA: serine protease [Rhizomicrobium sp.]|nr:serine protease [Rhizomicrobium sp.]